MQPFAQPLPPTSTLMSNCFHPVNGWPWRSSNILKRDNLLESNLTICSPVTSNLMSICFPPVNLWPLKTSLLVPRGPSSWYLHTDNNPKSNYLAVCLLLLPLNLHPNEELLACSTLSWPPCLLLILSFTDYILTPMWYPHTPVPNKEKQVSGHLPVCAAWASNGSSPTGDILTHWSSKKRGRLV